MLDTENLNDLQKAFERRSEILEGDAYQFGPNSVTEEEVVQGVVGDVVNALQGFEGQVRLRGLEANLNGLVGAVAKFKDDVHDGNVRRPEDAGHDDIVVQFADQVVYSGHSHGNFSFQQNHSKTRGPGQPGGTLNVVPVGDRRDGVTGTLNTDEWLFFTGDFIELNADAAPIRTRYVDIDGEDWDSRGHYFQARNTDAQVVTIPGALAKSTYDIDAYLGLGTVTTEYVPVAFQIARGNVVSSAHPLGGDDT